MFHPYRVLCFFGRSGRQAIVRLAGAGARCIRTASLLPAAALRCRRLGHVRRAGLAVLTLAFAGTVQAFDGWRLEHAQPVDGRVAGWDYVSLDAQRNRLFIGMRSQGLMVYDLTQGVPLKTIVNTQQGVSNGALLVPEFDLGLSYNQDGSLTPFSLATLQARVPLVLGSGLDSAHYDPFTKRVLVNMASDAHGTKLQVLQLPDLQVVGSIEISAKEPEGAVADGKGNIFLAARDENRVYQLNLQTLKVVGSWPTTGCVAPVGIDMDVAQQRVFLGCRGSASVKPTFLVMNAQSGAVVSTFDTGAGNDGVVYDAGMQRIFLANGVQGQLHVFEQSGADSYKSLEALGTRPGVRTLVLNAQNKKIYAVGAEGSADFSKTIDTEASPFYANTFFKNTFSVMTFSRPQP